MGIKISPHKRGAERLPNFAQRTRPLGAPQVLIFGSLPRFALLERVSSLACLRGLARRSNEACVAPLSMGAGLWYYVSDPGLLRGKA
jgi:hypothetical protein